MGIFSRDHYPTPIEVIKDKMLQGVILTDKIVLEPSAGCGNIVDVAYEFGAKSVIACEIEPELRSILSTKCEIIASDFMSVTSDMVSHVDLIIMNPPFTADETHILHAYNIAPGGCEIISLCNTNTLSNSYSKSRIELKECIENFGYSENLGSCFTDGERYTNVEVSLVRLFKPKQGDSEFEDYFSYQEDAENNEDEGLIRYNYCRDLVNRYCNALKMFDSVISLSDEINSLSSLIGGCSIKFGAYSIDHTRRSGYVHENISRETYRKRLQKECWLHVFQHMNIDKYVTKKVKENLNKMIEKQTNLPFTMRNIQLMMFAIMQTNEDRMKETLVGAFDHICSLSAENSTAGEKWKTNSNYMVNRKFIMNNMVKVFNNSIWIISYNDDTVNDIMKAICFITGTDFNKTKRWCDILSKSEFGVWYDWEFFRIKAHKKGTVHFEFKDENVWYLFNQTVARIKGWQLPPKQSKKTWNKDHKN